MSEQTSCDLLGVAKWNDIERARTLLNDGADVNAKSYNGDTPLHWACAYGRVKLARLFLDSGADIEAGNELGNTPLHWACLHVQPEIIKFLMEHGANPSARNGEGLVPIDRIIEIRENDPAREEILDLFRERYPDLVLEKFCTMTPGGMR